MESKTLLIQTKHHSNRLIFEKVLGDKNGSLVMGKVRKSSYKYK